MTETLAAIDTLYAHHTLPNGSKQAVTFLANLFAQSRMGKFYLSKNEDKFPEEINDLAEQNNSPIVIDGNDCYLRRNYDLECSIAESLSRITKDSTSKLPIPPPPPTLYPKQKEAFEAIFQNKLVMITGGPGSGKTYLAACVIEALIKQNPNAKIIATAPTGKAAFRLKHPHAKTKTLHSLLNIRQGDDFRKAKKPIVCDFLIIDECSMIEFKLFKLVFESILPHTHIILMGDPDQLPPIESGMIFGGLSKIDTIHSINLNETKRTDSTSLHALATAIRNGNPEPILHLLKPLPKTPPILHKPNSVILAPYKKGNLGTDKCNQAHLFHKRRPIMITQNDYKLGIMNGDIGMCEDGMATFDLGSETKTFPLALLSQYSYAFAISIHKSQGSEFDHVHLILPDSDKGYTRELIYTAVTRAKKDVTIYASEKCFCESLKQKEITHSNIAKRYQRLELH